MLKPGISERVALGDPNRKPQFYTISEIKPSVELTSQLLSILRKAIDPDDCTIIGTDRLEQRLREALHTPLLTREEKVALNEFILTWNWEVHTGLLHRRIYQKKLKKPVVNENLYL